MNLPHRAKRITEWIKENVPLESEFEERLRQTLLVNFQHVRRGTLNEVHDVLGVFGRTNYTETVKATVQEIIRKVRQL